MAPTMIEVSPGRVSVVTPCFNSGQWLDDAVASVAAQSYGDVEHIVVDDGSSEPATLDVLDRLESRGVRVIRRPHRGVSAARNAGLAAATGEFLQPLDADDLLDPRYCTVLVEALRQRPDAALAACDVLIFGASMGRMAADFSSVGAFLYDHAIVQPLMRLADVRAVGGYAGDLSFGEDSELYARLLSTSGAVIVAEPLYRYRQHPAQVTRARVTRELHARADILRRLPELYASDGEAFWRRVDADRRLLEHFERRYGRWERRRRT